MPLSGQTSITLRHSPAFPDFLAEQRIGLAVTTYQAGLLLLLGLDTRGRVSLTDIALERCMGLACDSGALHVAATHQIWRFQNVLPPGTVSGDRDAVFAPRTCWVTGAVDTHDVATGPNGQPIFVNTLFSCIATVSDRYNFIPLWRPGFISRLAAEDRCHLNGLAMREGQPAFATLAGESDAPGGWREKTRDGGRLIEIESGEVAVAGLSMPHSPRWYRDRLWLLNAGTGEFGWADTRAGRFEPVAFCEGYARGLTFSGDYAIIGTSLPRGADGFQGLPLAEILDGRSATPRCGIQAIDLRDGATIHRLGFSAPIQELYDVAVIPGVKSPMAFDPESEAARKTFAIGPGPVQKGRDLDRLRGRYAQGFRQRVYPDREM